MHAYQFLTNKKTQIAVEDSYLFFCVLFVVS